MNIVLAGTAGFCFGVNKAVESVYSLLRTSTNRIFTLGPIIHNEQVVEDLVHKGVTVADTVEEIPEGSLVVIRTHGITPELYERLTSKNITLTDATCPYVRKIHLLVKQKHEAGAQIVIIGDARHPEVIGINGWCGNSALIADKPEDIERMPEIDGDCCVVAQTTITKEKWEILNDKLKKKCKNIEKFDTICNATSNRQLEAEKLAKSCDMVLVIGSRNSSNTSKLYEISRKYCPQTYTIEKFGDLPPIDIKSVKTLGITAGASTPDWIIKEVVDKMEELNKQEMELSFKEAFESSLVTLQSGEIVKGRIIGYNNAEIYVDLGYKSDGIISVSEFSDDPDFKPETSLKVGDEVEVFIIRVNDGEGNVQLSKKKVDAMKYIGIIEKAYEDGTPVEVKVTDVTNGGLLATAGGVRVFIPASQVGERYVKDLSEYVKKTITVRITEYNKQKRKIVGSQRVLLSEKRATVETEFWGSIEVGKKYNGVVKSLTDFGAFVDIGGVDGLVHVSELSWSKIKHPSDVLKIGDKVDVTVLEFDREKKRISLGYRKNEDNPWFKAAEKYKVGEVVQGTVVRLVPFGAFVELEKGVDGLVHISQISTVRIAKPSDVLEVGMVVDAKVVEFNEEAKKIGLSIKEVNPINPAVPVQEPVAEPAAAPAAEPTAEVAKPAEESIPSEHKEEMSNTIGDALAGFKVEDDKAD